MTPFLDCLRCLSLLSGYGFRSTPSGLGFARGGFARFGFAGDCCLIPPRSPGFWQRRNEQDDLEMYRVVTDSSAHSLPAVESSCQYMYLSECPCTSFRLSSESEGTLTGRH